MSNYPLIDRASDRNELKKLNKEELSELCSEIREFLIESVTETGGHLASNLGTVELTVALHRVFDLPTDHLIFDVGHQAYTHKLLTGRREGFASLRKRGGMSGFTKRSESEYDCFGAGHSSTSVSAAIGFAEAERLKGSEAYTVAVLGDGAFTGGMIHEALNNCRKDLKLIIVLNENDMSISKNTGAFASLIARIRASKKYYGTKRLTVRVIKHLPLVGDWLFKVIRSVKQRIKDRIFKSNYFEDLGLYYLGPVDGHDTEKLERLLLEAKKSGQSTVIHARTVKGKGYAPAEKDPSAFHGVSPKGAVKQKNYSAEAGRLLSELADVDDRVCAVTAAMASGTGLEIFKNAHPDRFFDVGIAEEHALTFCAGLAANGFKPYFAVYSSFLQRGYDNLIHDIALQELPVTVFVDRAGISEGDGPTHHGIFDPSFLCSIPNMTVYAPSDFYSLSRAVELSSRAKGPVAIRYSNSADNEEMSRRFDRKRVSVSLDSRGECEYLIITYGRMATVAASVCDALRKRDVKCDVAVLEIIKPINDAASLISSLITEKTKRVVFLEEGIKNGGVGMIMREKLSFCGAEYVHLGIDDVFDTDKVTGDIFSDFGIGAMDVVKAICEN